MLHTGFANCFRPCLLVWASLLMLPIALVFAEPPQAPLTGEQREKLAKANRLNGEVVTLYRQGRFPEAVTRARQKIVEICKQALGEKHPDTPPA